MASQIECESIIHSAQSLMDNEETDRESLAISVSLMSHFIMEQGLEAEYEEYMNDAIFSVNTQTFDQKEKPYLIQIQKELLDDDQ